MKKVFHLLICLILICATGCGKSKKPAKGPPNVTTTAVVQKDVLIYLDAIGQAIPPVTVLIRPQVQGKILEAYVQQGSEVEAGEALYKIDPRPYLAVLNQTKAQLVHDIALAGIATKTVERYKSVVEEDFISKLTYEQYQSNSEAANAQVVIDRAAIATAQLNVDFCTVVAPTSGKISNFNIDVGNIVAAYDANAITTLRPYNPIDVSFSLPQEQLELVRKEQGNEGIWPFVATLPDNTQFKYEGTTYFIDNQVDQNTGTILLRGRFMNTSRDLWPGEFVRIKVLYKNAPNVFVVPPGAILMGNKGAYLYLVDKGGKATAHNVNVLTRTENYIAFESDEVKANDTVITDGQLNVAPGLKVNIANTKTETAPSTPKTT
jgi:multidrug efflux system membrane fusion protein